MLIRRALLNDWEDICELDRVGWQQNRIGEFIPDGEHVWRLWIEYAFVAVAVEDGKLVGFLLAFPTIEPELYFLHKLLISAYCRGKLLGSQLMSFCDDFADKHILTLRLTTDTNNSRMQHLAARSGYAEQSLVKGYYRADEHRLVLTRFPNSSS